MTETRTAQATAIPIRWDSAAAAPASPDPTAAVLYVCVARGKLMPGLASERAEAEGKSFAKLRGLSISDVIIDPYGEPDPCRREGWKHVRELAELAAVGVVIARWPACIAPDSSRDLRHREIRWLRERGVKVRYSWAPLVSGGDALAEGTAIRRRNTVQSTAPEGDCPEAVR
ncbi:hypothetical protein ABZ614_20555 [Streptomyces sp. NPDC013178]|uniref:hypothetical protein n=1 Tax=Streptomyces sp. NPDC013178 TaxID=3155118 RepID=UPI0033D0AC08